MTEKKINIQSASKLALSEIEDALVENDSFAFTRSIVPVVVPINRSGTISKKKSVLDVFVIAVGDTDAVDAFRANRNKMQNQIGAARAATLGKILKFED